MQTECQADMVAQIEALTRRLDEQAADIARLRRLTEPRPDRDPPDESAITSRRALLAAGAAAALLAPAAAQANVRSKPVTIDTHNNLGIAAAPGIDPNLTLPVLNATKHGVIGMADGRGPAPKMNAGVTGVGLDTAGVQGLSTHAIGVYGQSGKANVPSILAKSTVSHGLALQAVASGASGVAASFTGTVVHKGMVIIKGDINIDGDFTATGMKSAVLPHPDGSQRLVYCMESPQAWLEDFGAGELVNGRAEVALDPDFAAVCDTQSCHIFISEGSDHHLHVAARDAQGFTVEADVALAALKGKSAADLNGRFSYRVVGLRKDRPGARLEKFANG